MKARSSFLLLGVALLVGAGCVRLGIWQLDRLSQKRARNATAAAQGALPPLAVRESAREDSAVRYRRVLAEGVFDYAHEVALAARPRDGAPGVHLGTALALPGNDTVVLVLRGWVYSPDAATVDFAPWRERDTVTVEGYVLPYDPDQPTSDSSRSVGSVRRLDHALLQRRFGKPLANYYIAMTSGGASGDSVPERMEPIKLDEGSHLSYAIQWFLFATIFGAGGVAVVALRATGLKGPRGPKG